MARPVKHRGKWRIRWVDESGKRRSETHASYNEAEHALRGHQRDVGEIKRGNKIAVPQGRTLAHVFDDWEQHQAPLKRSGSDDISIIRKHLRPDFGHLTLVDFAACHGKLIADYKKARHHLSQQTIKNHLTLLNTMLRHAGPGEGCLNWIGRTIVVKKPKVKPCTKNFRWLKTAEQVRLVLDAARQEGQHVYVLYLTALMTGMREGELAGLRKDHVDIAGRLITVEFSYDNPTPKDDEVRHVPILDPLLPVLKDWLTQQPGPFVFPNERGGMLGESARVFQEVLHRVLDAAGFPRERKGTTKKGKILYRRYITFHGFRHTFASRWMMNGGDLFLLQKILGHESVELTLRYSHLSPDAFDSEYTRLNNDCGPPMDPQPCSQKAPRAHRSNTHLAPAALGSDHATIRANVAASNNSRELGAQIISFPGKHVATQRK